MVFIGTWERKITNFLKRETHFKIVSYDVLYYILLCHIFVKYKTENERSCTVQEKRFCKPFQLHKCHTFLLGIATPAVLFLHAHDII